MVWEIKWVSLSVSGFQMANAQKCGSVKLCDLILRGERGKTPVVTGIKTACSRERDGMLLICPARGKLLRRAGQYLAANVRMSCGGRQKTTFFGSFTSAMGSNDR